MKGKILLLMLLTVIFCCGCGKTQTVPETSSASEAVEICVIPNSFWSRSGTEPEKAVEVFQKLGEEYYTEAKVTEEGVELQLTEKQRDNLIQRNNDYHDQLLGNFYSSSPEYKFVPDESYEKLEFYYDENIPDFIQFATVSNLTVGYAMNQILMNPSQEWNVDVSIYHCHSGELVLHFTFPEEFALVTPEQWQESGED